MRFLTTSLVFASLIGFCPACTTTEPGEDDVLPDELVDGKLDSFAAPTDHGRLVFVRNQPATLDDHVKYASWTFALTAEATVEMRSHKRPQDEDELDTVMYLYKRSTSSWTLLEKNDNWEDEEVDFSGASVDFIEHASARIVRLLPKGSYRVIIKGRSTSEDQGPVLLDGACDGDGCPTTSCLFGAKVSELESRTHGNVAAKPPQRITGTENLPKLTRDQILAAGREAGLDRDTVTALVGASGRIELGTVIDQLGVRTFRKVSVNKPSGGRTVTLFPADSAIPAAIARSGEAFDVCGVAPQACVLGNDVFALQATYPINTERSYGATTPASSELEAQLLAAARTAAFPGSTLAEAFAFVDGGSFRVNERDDAGALGFGLREIMFARGGKLFGGYFLGSQPHTTATLDDGRLDACRSFFAR